MRHRIWAMRVWIFCEEKTQNGGDGHVPNTWRQAGYVSKCVLVCVSAVVSSPGTRPAGACSYHLKFQSSSHLVAVPGCDNTDSQRSCCVFALALSYLCRADGPIFFPSDLNLAMSNVLHELAKLYEIYQDVCVFLCQNLKSHEPSIWVWIVYNCWHWITTRNKQTWHC